KRTLVAALTVAALSACTGATGPQPATDTGPGTGGQTTTPPDETGSPVAPASVDVVAELWFAGFHVTLGTATFDPAAESGPTVTIEATFENLGSSPAIFDGTLSLSSGGSFYEPSFPQDIPNVPGLATGAGALLFDVDPSFAFDDAVLTVGLAENNRAVIPLGGTGDAVTLEPRPLELAGETRAGVIGIELTGGELRADVPDRHDQIEAGYLALTLDFDVTNFDSYAGGFAFVFGNNLALELPDGTTIAADDGPIELLTLGTTLPGQQVRFTVPDPPEGAYALVLIDDTEDVRSTVPFEIA
ncbi:MAG: hypothetical protein HY658_09145, partial [Actinobacteria bacterium]|nr:hypothetical protein [Actinomycetota bacterium]